MNRVNMDKMLHEHTGDILKNTLESVPEIRFISRVDEAMQKRGLTQNKLATICGLRPTTISEITKGSRSALTKSHIAAIMIGLRITDIREILDIEFSPETVVKFNQERKEWINDDVIPEEITKLYTENALAYFKGKPGLTINPDVRG